MYTRLLYEYVSKCIQIKYIFVGTPRSIEELIHSVAIKNKADALNLTVAYISYPQPTKIRWFFGKNMTSDMELVDNLLISNTLRIYRHVSEFRRTVLTDDDYGYYLIEINNGIGKPFKHIFQVLPESKFKSQNMNNYNVVYSSLKCCLNSFKYFVLFSVHLGSKLNRLGET